LGRPRGTLAARRKLDAKEGEIQGYLAKGISKRSIAKLVECTPSTLYDWRARQNLHSHRATTANRS
jgi:transposase-like protein